ncbi:hypothetical protein [Thermococcus barophilus]|uniref:Uncharacterized protein n=1 Tax=Thermococcus barophilus TaxID=55802 RepID=A0A0S1X882_THEBA|nr:hypothetical protein [Thermococcus barophilus]ALM74002.1 hypothetical protein TBCH5v1_0022 [Thermococcus barophilus]
MGREETIALQDWAKEHEIWKKESWAPFLRDLEKLYTMLRNFYEFHEWLKETFANKRISFLPEGLKDSARLIIAGGGDADNAFARMMYNLFGVKVAGAGNYEGSIKFYERMGDRARILVGKKILGISDDEFKKALLMLEGLISHFKQEHESLEEFKMHRENFAEWVRAEDPELVKHLNDFLNFAVNMLEPTNPYVMFIRYFNVAPLGLVIDFLECDFECVKSLAELLGAKVYNDELEKIQAITEESISESFWILSSYDTPTYSVGGKILRLFGEHGTLHRIIRTIYPGIDDKFKELWMQRFNSLIELAGSGKWSLPKELEVFIGKGEYGYWIKNVCEGDILAILLVKSNLYTFKDITGIDKMSYQNYLESVSLTSYRPPHCFWISYFGTFGGSFSIIRNKLP